MVNLPPKTITFKNGTRIDLDHVYGIPDPFNFDFLELGEQLKTATGIFLDEIDVLAREALPQLQNILPDLTVWNSEQRVRYDNLGDAFKLLDYNRLKPEHIKQNDAELAETLLRTIFAGDSKLSTDRRLKVILYILTPLLARLEAYQYEIRALHPSDTFPASHFIDLIDFPKRDKKSLALMTKEDCVNFIAQALMNGLLKQNRIWAKNSEPQLGRDLILRAATHEEFVQQEQSYKALYLRALTRLMAEKGVNVTAEELFAHVVPGYQTSGSQTLLYVKDFNEHNATAFLVVENESTTSYKFEFEFIRYDFQGETISEPGFAVDSKAINLLRKRGISNEILTQWANDFLLMAEPAEHDHEHQLTLKYLKQTNPEFASDHGIRINNFMTGLDVEDHALMLHAQVLHRLFEDAPLRKQRVLEHAAASYQRMHDMQQTAWANCSTPKQRAEVDEVITYLAEIYSHRLFRVISPEDPALLAKQTRAEDTIKMSVADAMDTLQLVSPKDIQAQWSKTNSDHPGLARIALHCQRWLYNTYRDIHEKDGIPVVYTDDMSSQVHTISAVDMMGHIARGAQARPDWKAKAQKPAQGSGRSNE